ncbi:SMI1/KNR4 family protein [Flavobacterium tyrosinilyticum]|uniref:SMI1/KNR4 family protein n=1 Tax=Flavobacterium tyrosinilyticum TaxID=1658740 RepID=UPI00202EB16C|nr:SMI1/KNR4 family protein [Flavobacterium tyrosinilyticum]MCM0664873.1 SMI1/KNR4 family protein [Flavobacterium tyrosinilyticum]
MWYSKLNFYDKQQSLTEKDSIKFEWKKMLPDEFYLPKELLELLEFSNGGGIINGDREFGYFSLAEIETFYNEYQFPIYVPLFLPIAFNGGGIFYAYDFRNPININIVAVSSGDLDYESSIIIGKTLNEVLNKTNNIEDELYHSPKIPINNSLIKLTQLRIQLKEVNENKSKMNTKEYLLTKRKLEKEIKEFNKEI